MVEACAAKKFGIKSQRAAHVNGERITCAKGERVTRARGERITRAKDERITRAKGERITRGLAKLKIAGGTRRRLHNEGLLGPGWGFDGAVAEHRRGTRAPRLKMSPTGQGREVSGFKRADLAAGPEVHPRRAQHQPSR